MDPLHQELIRQAAEDARAGKRDEARAKVESVLEEDDENIKAWLLLARLTTNMEERRLALTTILKLDPNNETAKKLLSRMEAESTSAQEQVVAGVSQQMLRLVVGGFVVFMLLLLLVVIFFVNRNNNQEQEALAVQTRVALQETQSILTATAAAIALTQQADANTATQIALVSPTPTATPTSRLATLPPSFTPSPTQSFERATAFPPPQGLSGRLAGWRGQDLGGWDALPAVFYNVAAPDSPPMQIGDHVVSDLDIDSSNRLVYRRYRQSLSLWELAIVDAQGNALQTPLDTAGQIDGFSEPGAPKFTADGSRLVFSARSFGTTHDEIYLLILSGEQLNGQSFVRLTSDGADYSFPDISNDGRRVVAVRTDENNMVDLIIINLEDLSRTFLTNDQNTLIETTPRWSPNGSLIAYAAALPEARPSHDIYIVSPDNPGTGFVSVDDPVDAIYPVFSPDGNFLAFASSRGGSYDIFIWSLIGQQLFQLTNDEEEDYPGGWTN